MSRTSSRRARRVFTLGVLLLSCGAGRSFAQAPTVSLSRGVYYVSETAGSITITVQISGPAQGSGGVGYTTTPNTAVAGADYTARSGFLSWPNGDDTSKTFEVPIIADAVSDPGEWFYVSLTTGDGVTVGDPAAAGVYIVEPGPSAAQIVVPDGVVVNGANEFVYPVPPGEDASVTVQLAAPPTSPVTVRYVIRPDATPHDLVFDGVQSRTVSIPAPTPATGEPGAYRRFELVPSVGKSSLAQAMGVGFFFDLISETIGGECPACDLFGMLFLLGFGQCPADCGGNWDFACSGYCVRNPQAPGCIGRAARALSTSADLAVLRQYRDQILAGTAVGQRLTALITDSARDITRSVLHDPMLAYRFVEATGPWLQAIAAINGGTGGSVPITADMQASLLAILDGLAANGSPTLAARIAAERTRLQLDDIAGLTAAAFQSRVETLGQNTSVETRSWGSVKAAYR